MTDKMMIYAPYQSEQNWVNAMTPFMGFMVMGLFMVAVCQGITKGLFEPEEEKFLPQTIRRVNFHRGDIDSAIQAAKRLKSDRDLYVFATYSGYTIDRRPPPGMQRYVVVHPDGTTKTMYLSSLPASQELDSLRLLSQITKPENIWITGSQVREVKTKGIDPSRDIDILIKVTDGVYKEPMQFTMKDIEDKIWEILPNADVFFFSERNPGELLSIPAWGKGGVLTDRSELYPNIVTNMWANAVSLQSLLTRETETSFSSLPGVIAMPTLPEEARGDFFFVEYVRDMLKLGEKLSDEDVTFIWESWKKSRGEEKLRRDIKEFIKKYGRDPFSPEAIAESERIEAETVTLGLSDREFERIWATEIERYYGTPSYMPQVTPEQIEFLKGYGRLAKGLTKSAREASKR